MHGLMAIRDSLKFQPSNRTLSEEETFILDVSPIVNGYVGDIGYSSSLIPNPILEEGMSFLLSLRDKIPSLFLSNLSTREIWWKIDSEIKANGFDNVHAKYPFSVLGHRVYRTKTPNVRLPLIPISFASWFSWQASYEFLSHKILPELLTPDHEGDRLGLWAIEPHLGKAYSMKEVPFAIQAVQSQDPFPEHLKHDFKELPGHDDIVFDGSKNVAYASGMDGWIWKLDLERGTTSQWAKPPVNPAGLQFSNAKKEKLLVLASRSSSDRKEDWDFSSR